MSGVSWRESLLVSLLLGLDLRRSLLKIWFCAWHRLGAGTGQPRQPHAIDTVIVDATFEEIADIRDETE